MQNENAKEFVLSSPLLSFFGAICVCVLIQFPLQASDMRRPYAHYVYAAYVQRNMQLSLGLDK